MTPLETLTLEDGDSQAVLAPTRGGILTRLTLRGRPVLYLDEATLLDETKNVRGGNPVLFPSPGPLAGDRFTFGGRSGAMKQHGVARLRPWTVASSSSSSAVLELASDGGPDFPWAFRLSFRYTLAGAKLTIEQTVENRDTAPMPFALGFHPYFLVRDADKAKTRVPTEAKRAWDNVAKRFVDVTAPIDLAGREVDLHLVDHGAHEAALELADGARIVVAGSEEMSRWVIWTLPGKDFVCLEPWTAPIDALNTGDGLLVVPAGARRTLSVAFSLS
jgi:galactose mutarotase-like enzyme